MLGHSNTWPKEVLERSNSSLEAVLAQVFNFNVNPSALELVQMRIPTATKSLMRIWRSEYRWPRGI